MTAADILGQFNAVITGRYTSTSDVEGRLATGTLAGGATFYLPRGTAAASGFGAVNALDITNGVASANVNNGGRVNWVNGDAGTFNLNGGTIGRNTPAFTMSDFTTPLHVLAAGLAALAANSTVNGSDPNNFAFNETPDGSGTAVFGLTTAQLSAARNIAFNGAAATIIVNVTGTAFSDTANFNASDTLNRHLIWNFVDAASLNFQGWHGTVLAEGAGVTNTSAMEGVLYAQNFTGGGELHDFTFAGVLPSVTLSTGVPEPGTAALLGGALVGLSVLAWRRAVHRPAG